MKSVRYRPSALSDLQHIHDYIAEHDAAAAKRVIRHILSSTERLTLFPHSGRAGSVPGTQELVVPRSRYIVVFETLDDIEVIGVFHGAQSREPS